jgi:hypothetical protein
MKDYLIELDKKAALIRENRKLRKRIERLEGLLDVDLLKEVFGPLKSIRQVKRYVNKIKA